MVDYSCLVYFLADAMCRPPQAYCISTRWRRLLRHSNGRQLDINSGILFHHFVEDCFWALKQRKQDSGCSSQGENIIRNGYIFPAHGYTKTKFWKIMLPNMYGRWINVQENAHKTKYMRQFLRWINSGSSLSVLCFSL